VVYFSSTARIAGRVVMLDVIFVAAAIVFFTIGALFVRGCEAI
jgi:hypothetical protein